MNQLNRLILSVSGPAPFLSDLDRHLIRVAMVFIFFAFSIQKWNAFTAEMLVPLISRSPVVFWIIPAFGIRGAGYFLGTTETIFGALILLGYWSPKLGILGALGSIVFQYENAFDTRPWLFFSPTIFVVVIALTVNFIGDGLRDAFDPRQKRALNKAARKSASAARARVVAR